MARNECACKNYEEFASELAIHFAGIEGLKKPLLFIYPKLRICMDCGDADFIVPEKDLKVLATGVPVDGTVFLEGGEIP
jgi:hypothetical protein